MVIPSELFQDILFNKFGDKLFRTCLIKVKVYNRGLFEGLD
jgi:hypothetical protein